MSLDSYLEIKMNAAESDPLSVFVFRGFAKAWVTPPLDSALSTPARLSQPEAWQNAVVSGQECGLWAPVPASVPVGLDPVSP